MTIVIFNQLKLFMISPSAVYYVHHLQERMHCVGFDRPPNTTQTSAGVPCDLINHENEIEII